MNCTGNRARTGFSQLYLDRLAKALKGKDATYRNAFINGMLFRVEMEITKLDEDKK